MNARMRAADVKMGVQIFVIMRNVFVSVAKAIAIFVLILVIIMILIMFRDRCMNPM